MRCLNLNFVGEEVQWKFYYFMGANKQISVFFY